ncbi:MAG: S8 family serine peptidase [Clostridiales Family XIII bacterium]|jgi:uncharacterized repeat protein (TIGR02543 family)|nr:S8 family serine peptidase [Clostridiales Family XIII bacterium]
MQILNKHGAKRIFSAFLALALILGVFASAPLTGAADTGGTENAGYIIKLKDGAVLPLSLFDEDDALPEPIPYTEGMFLADSLEDALPLIEAGLVESCEENVTFTLFDDEFTPFANQANEWYQAAAKIDELRGYGLYTGAGVKVAIVDSGVLASHEDLNPGNISGQNFVAAESSASYTDTTGHGTFISGIIAAQRNSIGVDGIADGAELVIGRAFSTGNAFLSDILSAIGYAVMQNADIINMSFGGNGLSMQNALQTEINRALDAGIILVAAVGNDGNKLPPNNSPVMYPAAYDGVIGVGMLQASGTVAPSSTQNSTVDVTAPGYDMPGLWFTSTNAYYPRGAGTSYATPVVTAMAALARQSNPYIDSRMFLELLKASVDDRGTAGYDISYGWGAVNGANLRNVLDRDQTIHYVPDGGSIGDSGYINTYRISDLTSRSLPVQVTKTNYTFAGWYDNGAFTGSAVSAVPYNAIGEVTYYAKWTADSIAPIEGVTVLGFPAVQDSLTSYSVTLPAGTDRAGLAGDIAVALAGTANLSVPPATADGGATWTFTVTAGGAVTQYTLAISLGVIFPPVAGAPITQASAAPGSLDGVTPAVAYTLDLAAAFTDVTGSTVYTVTSFDGTGEAAVAGTAFSYTPSSADAGKTVVVRIGAKTGSFASTSDLSVSIAVGALPASNSVVSPVSGAFDKKDGGTDLAVAVSRFGNTLTSVSTGGAALDYAYDPDAMPTIGGDQTLYLKASALQTLANGTHTVLFTFSGGRTESDKTVPYTLTVQDTTPVTPAVTAVTVSPNPASVEKGKTQQFTAQAAGVGAFNTNVTWSLQGASSSTVSQSGVLTVGAGEANVNLTVVATSNQTPSVKGTAAVTVTNPPVTPPGGATGGGGGGGGSAPAAAQTVPAADGSVSVTYTQSKGDVTLLLPDSRIAEIISKSTAAAVLDLSKVNGADAAVLPKTALAKLSDAGLATEIRLPDGTVTLSKEAGADVAKRASGANLSLSLASAAASSLNAAQGAAVKDGDAVFDISVLSGTQTITSFDGVLTATVPYSGKTPGVWYLDAAGVLEKLTSRLNAEKKTVSFELPGHLSLYVVGNDASGIGTLGDEAWVSPFSDVKASDWFYGDAAFAVTNGLFSGTDAATFSPNTPMTRGMLVTVLYRLAHQGIADDTTAENPFTDVPENAWYTGAVVWAYEKEIVSGGGGNEFDPDANVTRQDMAVILVRYLTYANKFFPVTLLYALFADDAEVAEYAKNNVQTLFNAGIVSGKPDNRFDPKGNATRAEAAAVLHRLVDKLDAFAG